MNEELLKESVRNFLIAIGENPDREGLKETPNRINKMIKEFKSSEDFDCKTFSSCNYEDFILIKNIEFSSFCEHHILPFYGVVHIAYIPDGEILGLSKLARIVEKYSKKLQVQEKLTLDIANELKLSVKNKGVAVIIEAKHMCMSIRGVKKLNSSTVTQYFSGDLKNTEIQQNLFFQIK